jgi:hypothetical protein
MLNKLIEVKTEETKMNETSQTKFTSKDDPKKIASQNKAKGRETTSRGTADIYKNELNAKLWDENDKKINHRNISFRNTDCITITDLFECQKYIGQSNRNLNLWDNSVDNDRTFIVDIALALRANLLILHGINNRPEKMAKIIRYTELIESLY